MQHSYFPVAFVQSLQDSLGAASQELLDALQKPSPTSIRYNEEKLYNKHNENNDTILWCTSGSYLKERPVFTLDPLFHAGTYYVQEAASMFLAQLKPLLQSLGNNCKALDLCAAPGGKSTHLANLLPPDALLVSNEVIRNRTATLVENLCKWGAPNSVITNNDPKSFSALPGLFDVLLIDAPCSGEGMFRKDPAALREWSPDNVRLCSERQRRIVADAWECLRENGIAIYSTCTFNRHENEENVQWIQQNLGAELIRIPLNPSWNIVESDAGYRFYPHKLQGEGFFISVLRKQQPTASFNTNERSLSVPAKDIRHLQKWVNGDWFFKEHDNAITALPGNHLPTITRLSQRLNVLQAGIPVGTRKGKDMVPAAALALSIKLNREAFERVEVDLNTALRFLHRDAISITQKEKGIVLLTYQNTPLGFVKHLGTRSNNLYPPNWRIRMNIS